MRMCGSVTCCATYPAIYPAEIGDHLILRQLGDISQGVAINGGTLKGL
jgi:hypothetical protein